VSFSNQKELQPDKPNQVAASGFIGDIPAAYLGISSYFDFQTGQDIKVIIMKAYRKRHDNISKNILRRRLSSNVCTFCILCGGGLEYLHRSPCES
jgi:hypothetical protein